MDFNDLFSYAISRSLSPRHDASSGCGWRNGPPLRRVAANILISSRGQPTRGGPTAGGLDEVLSSAHHKMNRVRKHEMVTRT